MKKSLIYGCEGRGDGQDLYLTRYTLLEFKSWQLCLHVFHRSDADDLHDHPWDFYTFPLWRGYREQYIGENFGRTSRLVKPFRLYFREAEHTHRVVLHTKKEWFADGHLLSHRPVPLPAVTLVLMLKKRREWGFWQHGRWTEWRQYFFSNRC